MLEAFEGGEPTRIVRPETGPVKSRQLNEAKFVGPSLGGFGPCCFLGAILESSVIALGGELAVARRHRFPRGPAERQGKNQGRRKRRKASRGAPQTMPLDGTAPSGKAEDSPQGGASVTDSGNTRAWLIWVLRRSFGHAVGEKPNGGPQGRSW